MGIFTMKMESCEKEHGSNEDETKETYEKMLGKIKKPWDIG